MVEADHGAIPGRAGGISNRVRRGIHSARIVGHPGHDPLGGRRGRLQRYSGCLISDSPVRLVPDENVDRFLATPMLQVGAAWTAELKRAPLSVGEQALKRAFDVLAAGLAIILLSPLMLTSMLLIKLDSKGPVLFTQARNGFNGRSFRIFKFRTMRALRAWAAGYGERA